MNPAPHEQENEPGVFEHVWLAVQLFVLDNKHSFVSEYMNLKIYIKEEEINRKRRRRQEEKKKGEIPMHKGAWPVYPRAQLQENPGTVFVHIALLPQTLPVLHSFASNIYINSKQNNKYYKS